MDNTELRFEDIYESKQEKDEKDEKYTTNLLKKSKATSNVDTTSNFYLFNCSYICKCICKCILDFCYCLKYN